jgi:hypothetical protein
MIKNIIKYPTIIQKTIVAVWKDRHVKSAIFQIMLVSIRSVIVHQIVARFMIKFLIKNNVLWLKDYYNFFIFFCKRKWISSKNWDFFI